MIVLSPNFRSAPDALNRTDAAEISLAALGKCDGYRASLHSSTLGSVEDAAVAPAPTPPSGYEPRYQICLPYHGLFAYSVGRKSWLMDSSRALFISPGWDYVDHHPVPELGHASILLNPTRELLEEICGGLGPNKALAFVSVSRPMSFRLRLLTHHMLRMNRDDGDQLRKDEWIVHTLQEAINGECKQGRRSSNVVDRAKQVLHARGYERMSLGDIAKAVGVTPVYLTQEFTRSEGVPLYRYQLRLKLDRALLELPHCNDITGLALDLGFSSHSHFTSVFRSAFGLTPSDYRTRVGTNDFRPPQADFDKRRAA